MKPTGRPRYFDFSTMVQESLHTKGAHHAEPDFLKKDYQKLFQNFKEARPVFVMTDVEKTNEDGQYNELEKDSIFSLPFACCWFEFVDKNKLSVSKFMDDGTHRTKIKAVMVKELSPVSYEITTFFAVSVDGKGNKHIVLSEETHDVMLFFKSWTLLDRFMSGIYDALDSGLFVTEQVNRVVHVPMVDRLKKTKPHEINQIVRIVPRRSKKEEIKPLFGGLIDWTHRWEVRGHWRRSSGIGKDRSGKYCMAGFTWVKEHEKGPEDKPLVKKIRVIGEETHERH